MEQLTAFDESPAVDEMTEETPTVTEDTPSDAPVSESTVSPEEEPPAEDASIDYEALAAEDLAEIHRLVPSLSHITHLGELPGATRYAELRDRGLGVEEAFWAACHASVAPRPAPYDNRSHLHSAVPRGASGNPAMMTAAEMHAAKELFDDLTESEIQKLYARCRA